MESTVVICHDRYNIRCSKQFWSRPQDLVTLLDQILYYQDDVFQHLSFSYWEFYVFPRESGSYCLTPEWSSKHSFWWPHGHLSRRYCFLYSSSPLCTDPILLFLHSQTESKAKSTPPGAIYDTVHRKPAIRIPVESSKIRLFVKASDPRQHWSSVLTTALDILSGAHILSESDLYFESSTYYKAPKISLLSLNSAHFQHLRCTVCFSASYFHSPDLLQKSTTKTILGNTRKLMKTAP